MNMKFFMTLIGMAAAGILGFSYEPELRYQLTGKIPSDSSAGDQGSMANTRGPSWIDPAKFPERDLPETIILKQDVETTAENSQLTTIVTAGTEVRLVRIDGSNVLFAFGKADFMGSLPYDQTDLQERLVAIKNRPAAVVPEPVVIAEPEPDPEPDPEPKLEPEPIGPINVVDAMKASIKAEDIKEFTFDQVVEWEEIEGEETIDGVNYQTGIAAYEGETVFGVKKLRAKALIKDGKLVRWVYEKSGMEIK